MIYLIFSVFYLDLSNIFGHLFQNIKSFALKNHLSGNFNLSKVFLIFFCAGGIKLFSLIINYLRNNYKKSSFYLVITKKWLIFVSSNNN